MWNSSLNISSENSAEQRLEQWNESLTLRLIPNDVILALYFVVGVVGNTIVLSVYTLRFQGQHRERYFVPFLALADLLACITCVTFTFYLNFHQADFRNETFCKVMWPLSAGTTFMSVFTLLVITIERYYKLCRPFHELRHRRIILLAILTMSVLIAAPSPLFFGTRATFVPERNLTRFRCTVIKDINSPGPNIYGFVLGLFSILTPITIAVVYIRIGWKLRGQMKFRQQFTCSQRSHEVSEKDFAKGAHSSDVLFLEDQHPGTYIKLIKERINCDHEHSNSTEYSDQDDGKLQDKLQSNDAHQNVINHVSLSPQTNEASPKNKKKHLVDEDVACSNSRIDNRLQFKNRKLPLSFFKQRFFSKTNDSQVKNTTGGVDNQATGFFNSASSLTKATTMKPKGPGLYLHRNKYELDGHASPTVTIKTKNICGECAAGGTQASCCQSTFSRSGRKLPDVPVRRHVITHNGHLYPSLGMHRFTVMFMLITGICCLCYLPKITLLILETVMTSFWASIPDQYLGVVLFLYRFYIFNNVCNPIIYCLFDYRFRREIKVLCCRRRTIFK